MINSLLKGQFNGIILNIKTKEAKHGYFAWYGMTNSLLKGQFNGISRNIKTMRQRKMYAWNGMIINF
jgi:hypothetical protein